MGAKLHLFYELTIKDKITINNNKHSHLNLVIISTDTDLFFLLRHTDK